MFNDNKRNENKSNDRVFINLLSIEKIDHIQGWCGFGAGGTHTLHRKVF